MDESLDPIDRMPESHHPDKVNPADRSNPDKKDNGFSNALKEKMKEKLRERAERGDEVILHDESNEDDNRQETARDGNTGETAVEHQSEEADESDGQESPEHIDLKA